MPAALFAHAVELARKEGLEVSRLHLRYLNPLPSDLGEILERFETVLLPEINMGQLAFVLRGTYLREIVSFPKVQGRPFMRGEILERIRELLGGGANHDD